MCVIISNRQIKWTKISQNRLYVNTNHKHTHVFIVYLHLLYTNQLYYKQDIIHVISVFLIYFSLINYTPWKFNNYSTYFVVWWLCDDHVKNNKMKLYHKKTIKQFRSDLGFTLYLLCSVLVCFHSFQDLIRSILKDTWVHKSSYIVDCPSLFNMQGTKIIFYIIISIRRAIWYNTISHS